MNNDEWSRLSPEQQAEAWRQHTAQQGPPPGFGSNQAVYGQQPGWGQVAEAPKQQRPFYKKKRYMIPLVLVVLFIILVATSGNSGTTSSSSSATPSSPPPPAHAISAHDWQLIVKDPDAHKGESIIVYGEVTQFDAATGTTGFRANVDGVEHQLTDGFADYSTNTILDGDPATLQNVVEKDLFTANVTVVGANTYSTQIGGQTTAPELQVQSIKVLGQAS